MEAVRCLDSALKARLEKSDGHVGVTLERSGSELGSRRPASHRVFATNNDRVRIKSIDDK